MRRPVITLDRCPKCGGNLGQEYDWITGWDIACLQCGFRAPRQEPEEFPRPEARLHGRRRRRRR